MSSIVVSTPARSVMQFLSALQTAIARFGLCTCRVAHRFCRYYERHDD